MEKLKPCHVCGGEAKLVTVGFLCYVKCVNCKARTASYFIGQFLDAEKDGCEEAIEAWNRMVDNGTNKQI